MRTSYHLRGVMAGRTHPRYLGSFDYTRLNISIIGNCGNVRRKDDHDNHLEWWIGDKAWFRYHRVEDNPFRPNTRFSYPLRFSLGFSHEIKVLDSHIKQSNAMPPLDSQPFISNAISHFLPHSYPSALLTHANATNIT